MKRTVLLLLGLLGAGHAMAQSASDALDLRVPEQPNPYAAETGARQDPPGTYYGDTSGKPSRGASDETAEADDGKAKVWGSFTTGIGHTKGYGTSHYNAAEVNVSKSLGENGNRVNMTLRVEKSDGPGFGGRYPYYEPDMGFPPPPR